MWGGGQNMITQEKKAALVQEFSGDVKNTGKTQVQIAIFSKRIEEITAHLKINPKDFSARRGLMLLVGKRRDMLDYLHSRNVEAYRTVIKQLGIRK